jgi:hypothetical protein
VRLNRSFIPDDLRKRETDIAYRVLYRDSEHDLVIDILTDHQSEADYSMSLRVLRLMYLLWQQTVQEYEDRKIPEPQRKLNRIIPIVFYTGARSWEGPTGVGEMMQPAPELDRFVPNHETVFLSLHQIPEDLLRKQGDTLGKLLWAFRKVDAPLDEFSAAVDEAVAYFESLPEEEQGQWTRAMHFLLLLIRHSRMKPEREELVERVFEGAYRHRERVEAMVKTDAEELIELGEKEGERRGLEKGRQEGLQEGLESLRKGILTALSLRFGPAPEPVGAAVRSVSETERLSNLLQRAWTCGSLDDFRSGLSQ